MRYYKDKYVEEKISEMEKISKSKKIEESYIKELVANQKGKLSVNSRYYTNEYISEGNWSLVQEDSDIEKIDETVDFEKIVLGIAELSERKKDSEYEYVFIPSYYAVKTLLIYYIKNPKKAEKIYNLKNAIIGGLIFISKYIGGDFDDSRIDFAEIMEALFDLKGELERNKENNDFINNIIDCINGLYGKDLILERRIENFNESKQNWFNIDFYKEKDLLLNYTPINDFRILGHNNIKKDFQHLQKKQENKAKEKIRKTPNHPNNDFPEDSEELRGNLRGWFSQRISKKDRLVYKKDAENKVVYIATACSHYDEATRRIKSTDSYKEIKV